MDTQSAHTSLWKTSDVIFSSAMLLGLVLDYFFPLSIRHVAPVYSRMLIGSLVVLFGGSLVLLAKVQFSRIKQPSAPGKPTTALVQTGVFSYTRNPLYLGLVIVLVGLGIDFNIVWWILLAAPVIGLVQWQLILPEERYLAHKFGHEYVVYARRVRRWV